MTEERKTQAPRFSGKPKKGDDRGKKKKILGDALRANLHRRKAQARARKDNLASETGTKTGNEAD